MSRVAGVIVTTRGDSISGARVEIDGKSQRKTLLTGSNGRFSFHDLPPQDYELIVSADGFETETRHVMVSAGNISNVEIVLKLEPVQHGVVVSTTETPEHLNDIPAQITVLDSKEVNESAAITLDDFLKEVPSFSLFRRTSSLVSQPTTNGVSLRGIGASGVSRTLVFMDGIPINDPVGSWVYWDQIPVISIQKIEVAPGGMSSLYGSSAMAGVIDISTRQPAAPTLDVSGLAGTNGTGQLDYWAGAARGRVSYSSAGSMFRTNGYTLVPERFRGTLTFLQGPKMKQ